MTNMADPHGRVFIPSMLEDDVLRLLAPDDVIGGGLNWLMSVVCDYEQKAGYEAAELPTPVEWNTVTAIDDWPIGSLPAVLIIAGGSTEEPMRGPDGYYTEHVGLAVAIVTSGNTLWQARKDAGIYAAAARHAIAAHLLDLPDPVANVSGVMAGELTPITLPRAPERSDTVAAGQVTCRVTIADSVTDTVQITEPPASPCDPIEEGPTVLSVDIRLNPDD